MTLEEIDGQDQCERKERLKRLNDRNEKTTRCFAFFFSSSSDSGLFGNNDTHLTPSGKFCEGRTEKKTFGTIREGKG